MPEYWDRWLQDPERLTALRSVISSGIEPVIRSLGYERQLTVVPNRWEAPGYDIVVRPGGGATADPAWRLIQIYADLRPVEPTLEFGGAAWFDEQGATAREPSTRWWCHTSERDETQWKTSLTETDELTNRIEANLAALARVVLEWKWDYDARQWIGDRLAMEEPRQYSSVEPGRRAD